MHLVQAWTEYTSIMFVSNEMSCSYGIRYSWLPWLYVTWGPSLRPSSGPRPLQTPPPAPPPLCLHYLSVSSAFQPSPLLSSSLCTPLTLLPPVPPVPPPQLTPPPLWRGSAPALHCCGRGRQKQKQRCKQHAEQKWSTVKTGVNTAWM